jgi:hypothetical protein
MDLEADTKLIRERKIADMRRFAIEALDPEKAPRLSSAVRAVRELLVSRCGRWVPWPHVVATGLRESDLAVKTVESVIRNAVTAGVLERKGEWAAARGRGRAATDTRMVRLAGLGDWPATIEEDSNGS